MFPESKPTECKIMHVTLGGETGTVVTRRWEEDEKVRCGAYPRCGCKATSTCTVFVLGHLGDKEARSLRVDPDRSVRG